MKGESNAGWMVAGIIVVVIIFMLALGYANFDVSGMLDAILGLFGL